MKLGMQSFAKGLGNEACYFLCLLEVAYRLYKQKFPQGSLMKAPEDYSIGELMDLMTELSFDKFHPIDYNVSNYEDSNNYFVQNAPILVQWLLKKYTGKQYQIGYQKVLNTSGNNNNIPPNSIVFQEWKWKSQHFRFSDIDSIQNSQTVKNGSLVSFRCFYFK